MQIILKWLIHFIDTKHHSLALSFQILAVKPVVKTSSIVTLWITLSIVEVSPALQWVRAIFPRVIEVERAVAVVPAARMIVTEHVTELVVLSFFALRDVTRDLHLWGRRYIVAKPSREVVIEDVASEAVEVWWADAVVEWRLGRVFTCAAVVAGVGVTRAVSGKLTFRPSKGWGA